MKVLLRNTLNRWFYQGPSKWTPRQSEALDLGQAAWAVDLVFREHLENVEILLSYDDPRHDMVMPVSRAQQTRDAGKAGPAEEPFVPGQQTPERPVKKKPSL